jgi:drug/metabolite transporter superfamily protein YnfA
MVDPMSQEERDSGNWLLKVVFVAVITASAGMIAVQAGATTGELLAAVGGGFVVSAVLLWYVVRTLGELSTGPSADRNRR